MALDTTPDSGLGITLAYGTVASAGSAITYTPILMVMDDAEFSGFENAIIELKLLVSGAISKIVGRTDYGTFTATVYLVNGDPGVVQIQTFFRAKAQVPWQVMLNDGTTKTTYTNGVITLGTGTVYQFTGPIASIHPGNFTGEDSPTLEFEIAISGPVTSTPGT